ncbi:hypothetical protein B5G43_12315 [Flavonifractor sp. An92]|uniref:ATP-binding protein n=1 Tax=Flavonifractor sp. An92 TaxID=1965666 RepID=UPI000B388B51|nr:AAA family ATPase [Flavonifractor sp. An92]OUN05576.1 hypothetical protein B5G43_12315 [Flavonifractor sp. An92]
MIVKRMKATFGRLQNETLELGEGLNLIEAPNEGGKSTWSAFLRAMLYGIPTKERDKQGFIAEKNRYQPWSGAVMEGEMEVEWRGRSLTIRRGQLKNTPFGRCEVLDTASGEVLPGFTADNVGEMLLGVSREVFERSAFVGQGATAVDSAPALEKRIAALISSGEEDVSYSQVERQLKDWLNRRKHNKTGLIPRLEEELTGLDLQLERQSRAHRAAQESSQTLAELREEQALLLREKAVLKARVEAERRTAWDQAQSELAEARAEEEKLRQELTKDGPTPDREVLRRTQEELSALRTVEQSVKQAKARYEEAIQVVDDARKACRDELFRGMTPDQAWEQATEDAKEADEEPPAAGVKLTIGIALLLGAAAGAVAALVTPLLFAAAAVLLAGGVALLVLGMKARRAADEVLDRRAELLEQYDAEDTSDILERARTYREGWERCRQASRDCEAAEQEQLDRMQERDVLRSRIMTLVQSFAPGVKDAFTLSAAISKALFLQEKLEQAAQRRQDLEKLAQRLPAPQGDGAVPEDLEPRYDAAYTGARLSAVEGEIQRLSGVLNTARGELNTLGDPALAQARRESAREELENRRAEYQAITQALESLATANQSLQGRFAPALNRKAGELLERLTGGAYQTVALTREFDAMAGREDEVLPHRALTLSRGAMDQLYLAVRLAVCELALPEEDPAPLVLDDALANFDDKRMALALDVLRELASERQILLFTCHSREGACLKDVPGVRRVSLYGKEAAHAGA